MSLKINKVIEKIVSIDNIEKVWGYFNHSDFWASKDHIYESGLVDLFSEEEILFLNRNIFDYVVFRADL